MNTKVMAIIQARMTSSRLPRKVLMQVMGRPLLSYQIERLSFSQKIDDIIIATTVNMEDDAVVELAEAEGVKVFRGSEHDVLGRYYQAATMAKAEHIMRLTADCPLIQPDICDLVATKYFENNADYITTGPSFAEGLDCEVLRFSALEQTWEKARLKSEREHVTLYTRRHPEVFKSITLNNETDDSKYRITVDREEDFIVVKTILENLYQAEDSYFTIREIKTFLDTNPEVCKLNARVIRNEGLLKSLREDKYNHLD